MSYGKLNKDIYENRRRLGYVTEMFEFYDKFSDPYGILIVTYIIERSFL